MADILTTLAPLVKEIDQTMGCLLTQDEEVVAQIGRYNFEGGGKRIRPLLFCLTSQALGSPLTPYLLEVGAGFEFLHMATLLHDDIVDEADTRRGRKAAHLAFGTAETVLGGDYFLSKAALLMTNTADLQCVRVMAEVVSALSLGELVQLGSRYRGDLTESEYFHIINRKTAVLMEGSTKTAAILAKANDSIISAAASYGSKLGLVFQILDDVLDYQSDQETIGKPVGRDLDEGKVTLPFILARENLSPIAKARLEVLATQISLSSDMHQEVQALVLEGRGVECSLVKASQMVQEAVDALMLFPPSPYRDHLESLAAYMVDRSR